MLNIFFDKFCLLYEVLILAKVVCSFHHAPSRTVIGYEYLWNDSSSVSNVPSQDFDVLLKCPRRFLGSHPVPCPPSPRQLPDQFHVCKMTRHGVYAAVYSSRKVFRKPCIRLIQH